MNILIYIGHPAQYHFFKNAIRILRGHGAQVKILIKTKDILEDLLREDGLDYVNIQPRARKGTKWSILVASFRRTWKVVRIARKFHADILVGGDSSVAQSAWLLNKPSLTITEDDIEVVANWAKLTYPFTSAIVVPTVCRVGRWEAKKIPYEGYMKLAYLHPNYFTPRREIVEKYHLPERYILLRLANLTAFHDAGIKGLNTTLVRQMITEAEKNGYRIYISSEKELDESLRQYRLSIRHTDIHHVMSFASLLVSDSQSMTVEATMLGTPSIRFSDFSGKISVLEELENKYRLTTGIKTSEPERLIRTFEEMISAENIRDEYAERHRRMLTDKIDVTAFFVNLIETWPYKKHKR